MIHTHTHTHVRRSVHVSDRVRAQVLRHENANHGVESRGKSCRHCAGNPITAGTSIRSCPLPVFLSLHSPSLLPSPLHVVTRLLDFHVSRKREFYE